MARTRLGNTRWSMVAAAAAALMTASLSTTATAQVGPGTVQAPTRDKLDSITAPRAAEQSQLAIAGGIERSPCPLADPQYSDIPVTISAGEFNNLKGASPGRTRAGMEAVCRHAAAGRGDLRNPRRRRHDPAQQGLSRRGPGAHPADRERRGAARGALCPGQRDPCARRNPRRRKEAGRLSRPAERRTRCSIATGPSATCCSPATCRDTTSSSPSSPPAPRPAT